MSMIYACVMLLEQYRKKGLKNSGDLNPDPDLNPDLCDAAAVFHQLSYQANWELDNMWVYDKPVESGYVRFNYWNFNSNRWE